MIEDQKIESIEITKARSRVTANTPAKFPARHKSTKGIDNILIEMKLENKSDYTTNFTRKALNTISDHADLDKPDEVRMFIAMLKTTDGYKRNLCIAYNKYTKFYNIEWNMPKYRPEAKNIALPTKERIQMLIADAGKLFSMKLQSSMETGLRPVELTRLRAKDLDLDHKTINPTTAKKGRARTLPLGETLTARLREHIANHNLAPTDLLFKGTDSDHMANNTVICETG